MKTIFSDQYNCPCIVEEYGDEASMIIEACFSAGAIYGEDLVIQLRPEVGPELWSESAVKISIPINKNTD